MRTALIFIMGEDCYIADPLSLETRDNKLYRTIAGDPVACLAVQNFNEGDIVAINYPKAYARLAQKYDLPSKDLPKILQKEEIEK